jgi:diguanylate cyclase (GGDEF)-like protein
MAATGNWSAQQLAEFLAGLSSADSVEVAKLRAVERAAEALESEVGALVREGSVKAAIGFPPGRVPADRILRMVQKGETSIDLDGLGSCAAIAVPLEGDAGHFMLARSSGDFSPLETNLLRAMGRVLTLSLTEHRAIAEERERRKLLGRLARAQRSISHNAPVQEVLDAISAAARELLVVEMAGMLLVHTDGPRGTMASSGAGLTDSELEIFRNERSDDGPVGSAMREGRLVVEEDFQASLKTPTDPLRARVQALMAAPVREDERAAGALVVASEQRGRRFSEAEREALRAFADYASLALADARLSDQVDRALHDPLTGLPNRAFLRERLQERLERDKDSEPVAVLFLNLDSFREINDRLGPTAGDGVLFEVAARLRSVVGEDDVVASLGGDEFAILPAQADEAAQIADSATACLAEPFALGDRVVKIAASIGLAWDDSSADRVVRNADLAMSKAKDRGGTCRVTYEPRMHSELVERLELEDDFARALDSDELAAHFQPKVDLRTRRVVGFEALARWRHPDRGLLGPGAFIEVAEDSGQMDRLTEVVLEQALDAARDWSQAGRRLEVSVNLSPSCFEDPDSDIPDVVQGLLARYDLPGHILKLEVTENGVMRHDRAARTLARLGALGIGLSIDDFGTGHSSLSRLKGLPIDELKIDRSFVMDLLEDRDNLAIVRATIELAHSMGLQVVAEGVETELAWDHLRELGCELAQGFLIAKPLPVEEVESWLERWEQAAPRVTSPALHRVVAGK